MLYLLIMFLCGLLGADAGGSTWWGHLWNNKEQGGILPFKFTQGPELLLATAISVSSVVLVAPAVLGTLLGTSGTLLGTLYAVWFIASFALSFASIETGHSAILPHQGVDRVPKGRPNTLTPFIEGLAKKLEVTYETPNGLSYKESYVWLFWAVKGFLMTLPLGGVGAVGLPLGYELGSHFKDRPMYWRYNPHFMSEFLGYALAVGGAIALIVGVS